MEAVPVLIVIFTFLIINSVLQHKKDIEKKKIDAALRMQEMEMGYPPGTYSSSGKEWKKQEKRARKTRKHGKRQNGSNRGPEEDPMADWRRTTEREQLKKGIENLRQRLENIETITESRKQKKEQGFTENDKETEV